MTNRRSVGPLVVTLAVLAAVSAPSAPAGRSTPGWQRALQVRSVALDRAHHLGRYSVPASAGSTAKPAWLVALEQRSRTLDRQYHLGAYAPTRAAAFRWRDAGIGAGFTAAACLAIVAALVALRRRVRLNPSA